MKYLLIILAFLFISCDMTEPETEETISLRYIYSKEGTAIHAPYTLNGVDRMTIDGELKVTIQCDWIKAVVKGDELINYEYYRYEKHTFREPDPDCKYYWRRK